MIHLPSIRPKAQSGDACDLLVVLGQMKHYDLYVDRRCRLLVAIRTRIPFESDSDIQICFARIEHALADITRKRFSLLVDARLGPPRNDPAYEAVLAAHRGKLMHGFAKNAAIAATAAAQMQIQRFARADSGTVFTTDDFDAAVSYLGLSKHRL